MAGTSVTSRSGHVEARDAAWDWEPSSLYIHIPFCRSRCFYCDFNTFVAPGAVVSRYLEDLKQELRELSKLTRAPLRTIFFGGGTPTHLTGEQIEEVMAVINTSFALDSDVEVTMEANPGSVDETKLLQMRRAGVNRISFGVQAFDDRLLLSIGRLHDAQTAVEALRLAKAAGFPEISVDLMFGLPEQTVDDVQASVTQALALGVTHVSAYWLKVEEGTPFGDWQAQGNLPLPGEDDEADMYALVSRLLTENGFPQYEVSNFAMPEHQARHNLVYWRNEPYLAAGAGAHGYIRGTRYENEGALASYHTLVEVGRRPIKEEFEVKPAHACEDTVMLGLRLREGVSFERFVTRHGVTLMELFEPQVTRLTAQGLVVIERDSIRLSDRAWPVANVVFEEFVGVL